MLFAGLDLGTEFKCRAFFLHAAEGRSHRAAGLLPSEYVQSRNSSIRLLNERTYMLPGRHWDIHNTANRKAVDVEAAQDYR